MNEHDEALPDDLGHPRAGSRSGTIAGVTIGGVLIVLDIALLAYGWPLL